MAVEPRDIEPPVAFRDPAGVLDRRRGIFIPVSKIARARVHTPRTPRALAMLVRHRRTQHAAARTSLEARSGENISAACVYSSAAARILRFAALRSRFQNNRFTNLTTPGRKLPGLRRPRREKTP
jgi:hypothetical protein